MNAIVYVYIDFKKRKCFVTHYIIYELHFCRYNKDDACCFGKDI